MKRKILCVLILLLCSVCIYSQQLQVSPTPSDKTNDWIRVRSETGDFSIEIPAKYSYFYDKDGITFSQNRNTHWLKEMQVINAYYENTLVSVESFGTGNEALKDLVQLESFFPKELVVSDFKRNNIEIHQIVSETSDYYCIRQYFSSKNRIYVLTAASRNGKTEIINKFLESLVLTSKEEEIKDEKSVLISNLKPTPINLITKKRKKDAKSDANKTNANKDETDDKISRVIIVKKPRPSYTDAARMKGVQGNIQLRLKFDENGYIPEIEIVKDLPEGLMRQAIFAAVRMKFLPEIENGIPRAITKTVEFSFTIY